MVSAGVGGARVWAGQRGGAGEGLRRAVGGAAWTSTHPFSSSQTPAGGRRIQGVIVVEMVVRGGRRHSCRWINSPAVPKDGRMELKTEGEKAERWKGR